MEARQKGTGNVVISDVYYPHSKLENLPDNIKLAVTRTKVSETAVGRGPLGCALKHVLIALYN